jgi:hypothetical protein
MVGIEPTPPPWKRGGGVDAARSCAPLHLLSCRCVVDVVDCWWLLPHHHTADIQMSSCGSTWFVQSLVQLPIQKQTCDICHNLNFLLSLHLLSCLRSPFDNKCFSAIRILIGGRCPNGEALFETWNRCEEQLIFTFIAWPCILVGCPSLVLHKLLENSPYQHLLDDPSFRILIEVMPNCPNWTRLSIISMKLWCMSTTSKNGKLDLRLNCNLLQTSWHRHSWCLDLQFHVLNIWILFQLIVVVCHLVILSIQSPCHLHQVSG